MDLTGKTLSQFRITEAIGRGGMAAVYKAYQPSLDRYVAIKVLSAVASVSRPRRRRRPITLSGLWYCQ